MNRDAKSALFSLAIERYRVMLRKTAGEPWPWTEDALLRQYHTCNVFRADDRVSRLIMRELLPEARNPWAVAVACRLLNREDSIRALFSEGEFTDGWRDRALDLKINTAAYKIHTPAGLNSIAGVVQLISRALAKRWPARCDTLQQAFSEIRSTEVNRFTAYQSCRDLAGTGALPAPLDSDSWAYMGIGAIRGALRLNGVAVSSEAAAGGEKFQGGRRRETAGFVVGKMARKVAGGSDPQDWALEVGATVLDASRSPQNWPPHWPAWSMGEVEHMLCEFDRYQGWLERGPGAARKYRPSYSQASLFQ